MALASGTRIGAYEVSAQIGVGGMGEVYRALDTNLKRQVAIKVLPASLAGDPDRLARFQREAEVLAQLNHPNIAAIHGLEKSDGHTALVMELVEGPTLADRIAQSAIPMDEALPMARQIAEALEAAHEQGIVHRDLKPANIKVRADGTVKVLDFGLAKAMDVGGALGVGGVGLSMSPTITTPAMTQAGMILGTAAYMSPEQARGKPVDRRADMWAFGCVLYEMLAGRRPFEGDEVTDVLARILEREPDWHELPVSTPQHVRRVIEHCLTKDRRHRLRDIGDATWGLEHPIALAGPLVTAAAPPPRTPWLAWTIAGTAAMIAAGLAVPYVRDAPAALPATRFTIPGPANAALGYTGGHGHAVLSPDGRTIAFTAVSEGGARHVWLRPLDALVSQPLPGTEGAQLPFWSPDSRSLGFFATGKLKKIDITGGTPLTVCDAIQGRGGTWSREGVIVFAPAANTPLHQVSAAGGVPTPLTVLDPEHGVTSHRFPWFLPDGRHFLFMATSTVSSTQPVGGVQVGSVDTQEARMLVPAGSNEEPLSSAVYAEGYLLFTRQNTLLAQPFDERSLQTIGAVTPVIQDVASVPTRGDGAFSVSSTGLLLFHAGGDLTGARLAWFDRTGAQVGTLGGGPVRGSPSGIAAAISADGRYVAASFFQSGSRDIRLYDLHMNVERAVASNPSNDDRPTWSPDGRALAYTSRNADLYRTATDGGGVEELFYSDPTAKLPMSWSPDGMFLLFRSTAAATQSDIMTLPVAGERKPWPLIQTPAWEGDARFAPDGRWFVYVSDESRRNEIYAAPFSGTPGAQTSAQRKISTDGGTFPQWRADGREILYLAPDRMLMSVEATLGNGTLEVGTPRALFGPLSYTEYNVSPDGQRLLLTVPLGDQSDQSLTILQNWTASLRK